MQECFLLLNQQNLKLITMKKILVCLIIGASLASCQKSNDVKEIKTTDKLSTINSGSTINVIETPLNLAISTRGAFNNDGFNVKVVRSDYSGAVLLPVDSFQYAIPQSSLQWENKTNTGLLYRGAIHVVISNNAGVNKFTKDVILSDSLGYVVNLDTALTSRPIIIGQSHLYDAMPKSYQ